MPNRADNMTHRWMTAIAAGVGVFIALGGSAVAAGGLIAAKDIAAGAVTSHAIKDNGIELKDLNARTRTALHGMNGADGAPGLNGATGLTGPNGAAGVSGLNGANGVSGVSGANGVDGTNGPNGANGANGVDGTNGANGPNGPSGVDGTDGADGIDGTDGADGIDGTDGMDGVLTPFSIKAGTTALPTASPPTVVVEMTVPAANYVVFAKTQLTHTGAGDTIDCVLKAGNANLDQVSMKTLPALAAIPVSLQAVTATSPSQLSVECDVLTANGSASFSSLIAIPIG